MEKGRYILHSLVTIILVMIIGCQHSKPKTEFYRGINERDTAYLTLSIIENRFYGKYEVRRSYYAYRTGEIRGNVKGDTLIGDYYYKPYGSRDKKRIPFALLQMDSALLIGKGVAATYMGIPFFVPDIPISYDNSEFVLVKINLDNSGSSTQKNTLR